MLELFSKLFKKSSSKRSAIVYYGKDLDYAKVTEYDYIIVQSDYIDTTDLHFSSYSDKIYSYVSLCEISSKVKEFHLIDDSWIVSKNEEWDSFVLDIRNKSYQKFLFTYMIEKRISLGFKNFFFDTIDSYQLIPSSKNDKASYEIALVYFINRCKAKYPEAKFIINRGFEIIDKVASSLEAVLFESYHFGLGQGEELYIRVSDSDKEYLNAQIEKINHYSLPIIALDYVNENDLDRADEAIGVIRAKGMIPYISNRSLDIYGRG